MRSSAASSADLNGDIRPLDLDWQISPDEMRAELDRLLAATELFDGRTSVLQVTDALGGLVRVRILVTAIDAPTLFDLRCYVREGMVRWVAEQNPSSMPRQRSELGDASSAPRTATRTAERPAAPATGEIRGLFTGDARVSERRGQLTGPIAIPRGHTGTAPIDLPDTDGPEPRPDSGRGDS